MLPTEARLAEAEQKLAEDRAKAEEQVAAIKAKLAEDRRHPDADREDLNERISRQQVSERDLATRRQQLDDRETIVAGKEKEVAARHVDLDEVSRMMQAKGLAVSR